MSKLEIDVSPHICWTLALHGGRDAQPETIPDNSIYHQSVMAARIYIKATQPDWLKKIERGYKHPVLKVDHVHYANGKINRLNGSIEWGPEENRQSRPMTISADGAGMLVVFRLLGETIDDDMCFVAMRRAERTGAAEHAFLGIAGGTLRLPEESVENWARRNLKETTGVELGDRCQDIVELPPQFPAEGSWAARNHLYVVFTIITKGELPVIGKNEKTLILSLEEALAESLSEEASLLLREAKIHILKDKLGAAREQITRLKSVQLASDTECGLLRQQLTDKGQLPPIQVARAG